MHLNKPRRHAEHRHRAPLACEWQACGSMCRGKAYARFPEASTADPGVAIKAREGNEEVVLSGVGE